MYFIEVSSKVKRVIKKMSNDEKIDFVNFIDIAEVDPFDARLKTHKLKGEMKNCYSPRLNYSDRVIFFIQEKEVITILDIGSHDEVY
jgi:mRNA-degrading endonuclease YafQ of YafQ-DinJ toxin-antitoxin module